MARLFEADEAAEGKGVNVDMDAVAETETMDVLMMVLKKVMKEEVKDFVDEEIKPKIGQAVAAGTVLLILYVAMTLMFLWWAIPEVTTQAAPTATSVF